MTAEKTTTTQGRCDTLGKTARPPASVPPEEHEEGGLDAIGISENVVAAVVRKYTLEVDGVVRFASSTIGGGLAVMIGRKSSESSVVVAIDGDAVSISVTLVLEFGIKVPGVAALVQDVIRSRVEDLTGMHVVSVNVNVQDLEEKTRPPKAGANSGE